MMIRISKETMIEVPKERSFDVDPGQYRAVLKSVILLKDKKTKKGHQDNVRLVFDIKSAGKGCVQYCAGKNYEPSMALGSDLREDLKSWRGHDLTADELNVGAVDLEKLIGSEADLNIGNIENSGHSKPFVFIQEIRPAGTLVQN